MENWLGSYEELEIELEEVLYLGHGATFGVCCFAASRRGTAQGPS